MCVQTCIWLKQSMLSNNISVKVSEHKSQEAWKCIAQELNSKQIQRVALQAKGFGGNVPWDLG